MPAIYSHYIFGQDVIQSLNKKLINKFIESSDIFNISAQSFDIFHSIKLNIKNASSYFHNHNVNLYFKNIITYIRKEELYYNSDILAYLYGSICHYVLDSVCHPFVFYYTGSYHANDKNTYKYKGKHSYVEYMIDAIYYYESNAKYIYQANISKLFSKTKYNEKLKNCIDYTFKNTFNLSNMGYNYNKAQNNFKLGISLFMNDRTGLKKLLYKIVDKTNIIKSMYFQNYSYHIKKLNYSVLNLEHEKWVYPLDKTIKYHYSYNDLYDIALEKAKKLITLIDNALDKEDEEINNILLEIGNLKYSTGLPCTRKGAMKYFKY